MEPIKAPKTFKVYSLVKQNGVQLTYAGFSAQQNIGVGFFLTQSEAEHQRTLELLKDTSVPRSKYHVFELDIPNPAYEGQE